MDMNMFGVIIWICLIGLHLIWYGNLYYDSLIYLFINIHLVFHVPPLPRFAMCWDFFNECWIGHGFTWADTKPPPTNFQGEVDRGQGPQSSTLGQPPKNKSEIFKSQPNKCCLIRLTLKKTIALASLKAACPYNPYWVHFILKVQNPIYLSIYTCVWVCVVHACPQFHWVNKQSIGISFPKWNRQ